MFFRYTVQRDDSLSKIAQQYLGDRFRFHILAKYNDISNPSKLAAGQVIKIPGRAPPPGTPQAARARADARADGRSGQGRVARERDAAQRLDGADAAGRRPAEGAAISRAPTTRIAKPRCAIPATATPRRSATRRAARSRDVTSARPRRRSSGRTSTRRSTSGIACWRSSPTTRRPSSSASARSICARRLNEKFGAK